MTDETKGRVLAERLFASGKVKRPTWNNYPMRAEDGGTGYWAWGYTDNTKMKHGCADAGSDDLACMAIVRALRSDNHTVRACPLPDSAGHWWSTTKLGTSELPREHATATTDLLALSLLACCVFGIDDKVEDHA